MVSIPRKGNIWKEVLEMKVEKKDGLKALIYFIIALIFFIFMNFMPSYRAFFAAAGTFFVCWSYSNLVIYSQIREDVQKDLDSKYGYYVTLYKKYLKHKIKTYKLRYKSVKGNIKYYYPVGINKKDVYNQYKSHVDYMKGSEIEQEFIILTDEELEKDSELKLDPFYEEVEMKN
jgi:hypothetical protein